MPDFERWFREAGRHRMDAPRSLSRVGSVTPRVPAPHGRILFDHPTPSILRTSAGARPAEGRSARPLRPPRTEDYVPGHRARGCRAQQGAPGGAGCSIGAVRDLAGPGDYAYADGTNVEHRAAGHRGRLSEADWLKLSAGDDELVGDHVAASAQAAGAGSPPSAGARCPRPAARSGSTWLLVPAEPCLPNGGWSRHPSDRLVGHLTWV